ncbi:MAG: glycosyltransferase [Chloroflexi bacterium]|nr:glycosyltransferase [Chloroflexota bacterium]
MPAYNAERFLHEALESVMAQTYEAFELIFIDDGSTDGSRAIAEAFAATDRRIRVISRENRGLCASLNQGIDLAHGPWVAIMHADDVMEPDRIERQIAFIEDHPHLAVASSFVTYIDEKGRTIGRYVSDLVDFDSVRSMYEKNEVVGFHHPAVMLRKDVVEAVGGYRDAFWPCEDVDLWNRILEHGHQILVQPEFLLRYRFHGSSASISRARLLQRKFRWVEACIVARRSGREEPSWNEFLVQLTKLPWWARVNLERVDLARSLYKAAVLSYSQDRTISLMTNLSGAALLAPILVVKEVRAKFTGSKATSASTHSEVEARNDPTRLVD